MIHKNSLESPIQENGQKSLPASPKKTSMSNPRSFSRMDATEVEKWRKQTEKASPSPFYTHGGPMGMSIRINPVYEKAGSASSTSLDSADGATDSSPITPTSPTYTTDATPLSPAREDRHAAMSFMPCPADIWVAMMDRPAEMKHLVNFHKNEDLVANIKRALGDENFATMSVMWEEVDRKDLSDVEWLRRTKYVLEKVGAGDYLWNQFCNMVGYDQSAKLDLSWDPTYLGGSRAAPSLSASPLEAISEDE